MSGKEEIKQIILDWFEGQSREGIKTKFYLKDVVKALPELAKPDIQKAVFECIDEETLMWFSLGSTSMLVLPKYHKG